MAIKTFREALNEALREEMQRDKRVFLIGEDIPRGMGGHEGAPGSSGGMVGVTKGLYQEFGPNRVIDTPISESAIMGAAAGAALAGMRPVAEMMFMDFFGVCFDQIYNQAAKFRYMFGGQSSTPMVIRGMVGAGFGSAAQHSQALWPIFTHIPGLKVALPSCPADAKGLLISAIRDQDPVIFLEHKVLYDTKYVTEHQYLTETVLVMQTKRAYYTDVVAEQRYYTETARVPYYVTKTAYHTEPYAEYRYVTETQLSYEYITETQDVPYYVTQTLTNAYPEYKNVYQTETQHQYVTVTKTQYQNQYVTVCPKPTYPSYGK